MNKTIQQPQILIVLDEGVPAQIIPDKKVQDIPHSDTAYTVVEGKPVDYLVLLDGKKYKVQADENRNPVKISRYNEKHKMYVTVCFSDMENTECERVLTDLLKCCYIRRVTGALKA